MPGLACREYVTTQGSASPQSSLEARWKLEEPLHQWVAEKRIVGFRTRNLYSTDDILDADLDEAAILEATGGVFPSIFVNVTFEAATFDRRMLQPWEALFELRLLVDFTAG